MFDTVKRLSVNVYVNVRCYMAKNYFIFGGQTRINGGINCGIKGGIDSIFRPIYSVFGCLPLETHTAAAENISDWIPGDPVFLRITLFFSLRVN